ncbi:2,3-bisphosphoglycerate-independent phosphoglycerate mutase [Candidatus Berkelbacteria bacterium CG10_big_fil_rev_8_21_14_0_10_43_13]|uniref:2,3-bisphosphoglycerate-independent phosphoglycerate mutase n=1 Tax=Candidatus Berkelbacteria bacterium CG10_big_fil_rev_8_21_14_0_10_43_13 TaxID=1974514 RepID=A0A2H0W8A7_9BACT|nr:MAG: 2,3-bisphosphoglycerate-independent phosphoglycerate mutase [Candidatus Berkelbacteria bacterium CG10_big_fil_rev_8_21_14_0_10_43_13]
MEDKIANDFGGILVLGTNTKKNIFGLIILDGWGVAPVWGGNALSIAEVKNYNTITKKCPHTTLQASGTAVGLPAESPGNSEAGHLNIGAGHVVYQDQSIIDKFIEDGSFEKNEVLNRAIHSAQQNHARLHLMGLLSKTGTHSQISHIYAILRLCKKMNFSNVYLHIFTDGRDSEPMTGIETLAELENQMREIGVGQISTIIGRFYAMDRDNRWERIAEAYDLLTLGKGTKFSSAGEIFTKSYARGMTDEFIEPSVIINKDNHAELISDNDSVVFFNYRADRARELTNAFLEPDMRDKLPGRKMLKNLYFASFVMHGDTTLGNHVFEPQQVMSPLAEQLSLNNLRQYHTAETEKYAHVTYFLNGGREKPFPGEDWKMVPSPRDVPTYDLKPEMSAQGVTDTLLQAINKNIYDTFIVNFANADMVGHTGNMKAAVKAVEFVDKCLGEILNTVLQKNGTVFVFADHGNAEQMVNPRTGEPDTEHTTNPVPFIIVSADQQIAKTKLKSGGSLSNIVPTVLDLMKIPFKSETKAESLVLH